MEAVLFRKCLGLNDSPAISSQKAITNIRSQDAGSTELIDCLNMTVTDDFCVEKIPPRVVKATHSAAVAGVSAGSRLMFKDAASTYELAGSTIYPRFTSITGPISHSLLDVRVAHAGTARVYKSPNDTLTTVEDAVGSYAGPATSTPFYKMPMYIQAFMHGARMAAVAGKFVYLSRPFYYNLWAVGDDFLNCTSDILQAGSLRPVGGQPGSIMCTHAAGVTLFTDTAAGGFTKKFFACKPLNGSLYSGFVPVVNDFAHVFLCDDGIYTVDRSGALVNQTLNIVNRVNELNTSYVGAGVVDGKYLAVGDTVAIEHDFNTKTTMKQGSFNAAGVCVFDNEFRFAQGSTITAPGAAMDDTADFECSITLPYSDYGMPGRKNLDSLYFTGVSNGDLEVVVSDQDQDVPERMRVVECAFGTVQNYRIKMPRETVGSKVSIQLLSRGRSLRIENLQMVFTAGNRR